MSPQRRRPTGGIVCKGSHPERRCHCASAGRWRPRAEVMEMPEFSRKYTIMPHPALASTVLAVAVLAASACASSAAPPAVAHRSEEHTSELQSLMRISYAVFCLQKKRKTIYHTNVNRFNNKKTTTH